MRVILIILFFIVVTLISIRLYGTRSTVGGKSNKLSSKKRSHIMHDLNSGGYTGSSLIIGGVKSKQKKHWTEYNSWAELDNDAINQYMEDRAAVLNIPYFKWTKLYDSIVHLLSHKKEWIGIINKDSNDELYVKEMEESHSSDRFSGTNIFASVPAEQVSKFSNKPALFIFHTHPNHVRCDPMPSSNDLNSAIENAINSRFAYSIVVSSYGMIFYGLEWPIYKEINEKSGEQYYKALNNYCLDVTMAHESMRSMRNHSLDDYIKFYENFHLKFVMCPSPKYIADSKTYVYKRDLLSLISYNLLNKLIYISS